MLLALVLVSLLVSFWLGKPKAGNLPILVYVKNGSGGSEFALFTGRVLTDGKCVYGQVGDGTFINIVWNATFSIRRKNAKLFLLHNGLVIGTLGEQFRLVGGFHRTVVPQCHQSEQTFTAFAPVI
jgi:hypothetical protein